MTDASRLADGSPVPSAAVGSDLWEAAGGEMISLLRDLIRIPSVVPRPTDGDGETRVAMRVAAAMAEVGLEPEVIEPEPGRGSVSARLLGSDPDLEPLLLLSHLDVVPVTPEWTHDPFGADLEDDWVYGRGAVDMKNLLAMQVTVVRMLARRALAAGRDPSSDPVPGLRRGVLLTSTADEEAGGMLGAGWLAQHRPDLLRAAGAINECGGIAVEVDGRRLYPVQVAEKGVGIYRITVTGSPGHGSMPREDNAAVLAARVITALAKPSPLKTTQTVEHLLSSLAQALPGRSARVVRMLATDPERAERVITHAVDPTQARVLRSILRDTASPNVVAAGIKGNVIPGSATVVVDVRPLPGMDERSTRDHVLRQLGDLVRYCEVEQEWYAGPVESPSDTVLFDAIAEVIGAHDPGAAVVPMMAPFSTDAKHTAAMGIPTYGFSPMRLPADEPFLDRFHGIDERVSVSGLRWGLPVLYDVVARYCG